MRIIIKNSLTESISITQQLLDDSLLLESIETITQKIILLFQENGKLFFCGNGGSAADAQHLAAEFSGKFYIDRRPLFAEALHTNTSFLTAVANDYGYEQVFARSLAAKATKDDILIGLSTSGNSENVLQAFQKAKEIGVFTVGFSGIDGGKLKSYADIMLRIPSNDVAKIQEAHILLGHIICKLVEQHLFS